jgi:hypothetical protein
VARIWWVADKSDDEEVKIKLERKKGKKKPNGETEMIYVLAFLFCAFVEN